MSARRRLPLRALRSVVAAAAGAVLVAPAGLTAQESPTLRLSASPALTQQMEEAPEELAWAELAGRLTVECPTSGPLGLDRVPVRLVALGVRDGEIVGEATTAPSIVSVGGSAEGSGLAGGNWPPAGEWFPAPRWRASGLSTGRPVTAEPETVASETRLPSDAAAAVVLYAAPAAAALRKRFVTVPIVVTTRPSGPAADTAAAEADSTGG